jgi:cytoskeletal protein CcmA (bactofilin family)
LTRGNFSAQDNTLVDGNVGVSGSGNFNIQNFFKLNGDLYMNSNGKITIKDSAQVTGQKRLHQDTLLNNAWNDAISLSNSAASDPVTSRYSSLTNVNLQSSQNITITGSANEKVVLSLQNFQLSNSSTFTLQGTATTTFIINVANNFSLIDTAQIKLVNVPTKNVLFNVLSNGTSTVMIQGSTNVFGNLLALNRTVSIQNNAKVTGRVIAKQVSLQNFASVVTPVTNP